VNIVNHAYWNLEKIKKDIFGHGLHINSDYYTQMDKDNIPTGKKVSVNNTTYDFRKISNIGEKIKEKGSPYDENFIVRKQSRLIAKLISPKSRIQLTIFSNHPAVQFYTGQYLRFISTSKKLKPHQGMCLETQCFPNSPNNKKFPSSLLMPKETYLHNMKFRISDI
jgi:aldose 1-epimerase